MRAEMEQEQSKHDRAGERKRKQKGTASEESKAKSQTSETTALPSCYTWLQRMSTCIFPDILLCEAFSAHAYS